MNLPSSYSVEYLLTIYCSTLALLNTVTPFGSTMSLDIVMTEIFFSKAALFSSRLIIASKAIIANFKTFRIHINQLFWWVKAGMCMANSMASD